jgi:hypothetical protein
MSKKGTPKRQRFRCILAHLPLLGMLLAGCSREPPPVVADLHFPVAVLFSNSSAIRYDNAADLGVMPVQLVINSKFPPILIDSQFNILTLQKLSSIHGGLWLMVHPSGNTEVTFDLKRAPKSGLDAARSAMRAQLDMQDWRTDLDQRRTTLATQTTLPGMLTLLQDAAE